MNQDGRVQVPAVLGRRLGRATLDDRSPAFIRHTLPLWSAALAAWFRPDIRGLDRIPPEGPVLLVGNHSGGNVSPDSLLFTAAFIHHFGTEREFLQLAHDLVIAWPPLWWLPRYGTVAASPRNARMAPERGAMAPERGAAVLVYPGGDWEVHRPVWQGHRVDLHHRTGFIRTALQTGAPIVPVIAVGGQETSLFLSRGERLAHVTRHDRLLRVEVLPLSIVLPWGVQRRRPARTPTAAGEDHHRGARADRTRGALRHGPRRRDDLCRRHGAHATDARRTGRPSTTAGGGVTR